MVTLWPCSCRPTAASMTRRSAPPIPRSGWKKTTLFFVGVVVVDIVDPEMPVGFQWPLALSQARGEQCFSLMWAILKHSIFLGRDNLPLLSRIILGRSSRDARLWDTSCVSRNPRSTRAEYSLSRDPVLPPISRMGHDNSSQKKLVDAGVRKLDHCMAIYIMGVQVGDTDEF
jgi:hypothetical protein